MSSDFQANEVKIIECSSECRKQIEHLREEVHFLQDQLTISRRFIKHIMGKSDRAKERISTQEGKIIQQEAFILSQSEEIARLRKKLTKYKTKKKWWQKIFLYTP